MNDNGPNAALKGDYNTQLEAHQSQYPGVPYTPPFFNLTLSRAWIKFSLRAGSIITRAAQKCGYSPDGLNPRAENYVGTYDTMSCMSGVPRNKADIDSAIKELVTATSVDHLRAQRGDATLFKGRVSGGGRKEPAAMLVRDKAVEWFTKSALVPAKQLAQELKDHEKAKRNKAKPAALQQDIAASAETGNVKGSLSTQQGLVVTEAVLKVLRDAETERSEKASKKEASAAEKETRRVMSRVTAHGEAEKLKGEIIERSVELGSQALSQKFKASEVKTVLMGLGVDKPVGTKPQMVEQLVKELQSLNLPLEPPIVGRRVIKDFEGSMYTGEVMKIQDGFFMVKYSDGDSEDMTFQEVKQHLCQKTGGTGGGDGSGGGGGSSGSGGGGGAHGETQSPPASPPPKRPNKRAIPKKVTPNKARAPAGQRGDGHRRKRRESGASPAASPEKPKAAGVKKRNRTGATVRGGGGKN